MPDGIPELVTGEAELWAARYSIAPSHGTGSAAAQSSGGSLKLKRGWRCRQLGVGEEGRRGAFVGDYFLEGSKLVDAEVGESVILQ